MSMSGAGLLDSLREHRVLDEDSLDKLDIEFRSPPDDAGQLADELRQRGMLTAFQIGHLLLGKPQDLILGQYVLVDRLGEGGMGQVFKAFHRVLKSQRAVKVIRPDCITSKATVRRFYREVELVARLKHPNIIHAYDAAQDGERHYFVMEYAPGQDLAHVIKQRGPLPVGEACEYIRQAATGLQHAHVHGLVHRDIKPSNMLLSTEDGCIKVLDLGLAKLREGAPESDDAGRPMTPAGMMMGTPDFMAPEQAENSATADIRADIYSLGCTLYQFLTGRVPFPCSSLVEKLTKHYAEKPVPMEQFRGDLPPGVSAIVDRMMAKLPDQRYQVPAEVAEALAPYCTTGTSIAPHGESSATLAPGTRVSSPSILPPGTSAGTVPIDPSHIPQTMQLPPDALSGKQPMPKPGKDSRTVMMTEAPYSLTAPPETGIGQMTPRTAPRPPVTPPGRKPWLVIGGVGLIAATVAVIGFSSGWFGKSKDDSGDRVVNRDDVRKTDDVRPVQDRDIVKPPDKDIVKPPDKDIVKDQNGTKDNKPTDKVNPIPVTPAPLGVAKKLEGASLGQVAQVKGGKGDGAALTRPLERPREDWQKPEVITPLVQGVIQAAFSADGTHLIVRTKSLIDKHDLRRKSPPETITPFKLLGGLAGAGSILEQAVLSPDGRLVAFITVCKTEKAVRGNVSLNTEYDTIVATDGSAPLFFFGDVADATGGTLKPRTRSMVITPDGNAILAGSDRQLKRWAIVRERDHNDVPTAVFEAGGPVQAVAVSPNGKYGVAGLSEHGMRLFQLDKKDDSGREYEEQSGAVEVVIFLGNDRLVSGHFKGQVCVWDVNAPAGPNPVAPKLKRDWHKSTITALAGRDELFASGARDGEVTLATLMDEKPLWKGKVEGAVKAMLFAPDGSALLYATDKFLGRVPLVAPSPAVDKPAKDEPNTPGKKEIRRD